MNEQEQRLFRKLVKSESDEVRNSTPVDLFAGTTSVQPTSDDDHPQAKADYANTTIGRGNPADRSGGPNIPPKQPGLETPMPTQLGGSNTPASSITQLPGVLQQTPGQIVFAPSANKVVISAARDVSYVARTPSEAFLSENDEPRSPAPGYPPLASPSGDSSSDTSLPSHGNIHAPFRSIGARTMMGADANPLSPGDSGIGAQVLQPMKIQQERAYVDRDRPDARDSALVQGIPTSHILAGTIRQEPIVVPQEKEKPRYPGDFNKTEPLTMHKPEASNSAGVQPIPQHILTAGVRSQKVRSDVLHESDGGA
jgi:hypothetical protein